MFSEDKYYIPEDSRQLRGTVPGILKREKPHINILSSCQMRCAETIRLMKDKQGFHLSTMYECVYVCTHVALDL
jgi:hypothetical protein